MASMTSGVSSGSVAQDKLKYAGAGSTSVRSNINPVTGTAWGTGTAQNPTTPPTSVTSPAPTPTKTTSYVTQTQGQNYGIAPTGTGTTTTTSTATTGYVQRSSTTGTQTSYDGGKTWNTNPTTGTTPLTIQTIGTPAPTQDTGGFDLGKTIFQGITGIINISPLPVEIDATGQGTINVLKPITNNPFMPFMALKTTTDVATGNFNPVKDFENTLSGGAGVYAKASPETRDTVTALTLTGGGLMTLGVAPVVGTVAGAGAGTATTIGGLVATTLGTPQVVMEVKKQGTNVLSATPEPVQGVVSGASGVVDLGLGAVQHPLGLNVPILSQINFTQLNPVPNTQSMNQVELSYEEQVGAGTAGGQAVSQELNKRGFQTPIGSTDAILGNLLPSAYTLYGDNPQTFKTGAYTYFKGLGYDDTTALAKAEKVYAIDAQGRGFGEIATLFTAGAIGEYGVRTAVANEIKNAGVYESKQVAVNAIGRSAFWGALAPSAIEGGTLYASQQISRRQPITPEGLLISSGVSALTGGLGARWIARTSITNPVVANVAYKSMWLVQPDEPAGDIFADVLTGGSKNIVQFMSGKANINVVSPTATIAPSDSLTGLNMDSIYRIGSPSATDSGTGLSTVKNSIYTPVPSDTITDTLTDTSTTSPSDTITDTITNTNNTTNTTTNTWTNTWTNTATETNTATYTNTITATETATYTGNLPFVPFLPLGGTGDNPIGSGARGRASSKYYNEVASAVGALGAFKLSGQVFQTPKKSKKKAKQAGLPKVANYSFKPAFQNRAGSFFSKKVFE